MLSPEQEALLGCGPFWGTNCDISGIDLLNTEASALLQSFAGAAGTLTSLELKQQGVSFPGTEVQDFFGNPVPFRAPDFATAASVWIVTGSPSNAGSARKPSVKRT